MSINSLLQNKKQNYKHLHFTLTMILMISNIYDLYKKVKTSIDDRHCRGETTHRQNKLWQFIVNIMVYIKIYIMQI
jgi:hypothetical protein